MTSESLFEYVDDDEYARLVQQRQEDDWICDDGTSGYPHLKLLSLFVQMVVIAKAEGRFSTKRLKLLK